MCAKRELIGLYTLVNKEVSRVFRIWAQTLLPSPMTMILYFVIFGNLIGPRIGELEGFTYIQYIVPGLIMMGVVNNSYSNVVSSFYGARFMRNIDELFVSPLSVNTILLGYILGGLVRGLVVGLLVLVVGLFFTEIELYSLPITLFVVFLTAFLFSVAGIINGVFARKFDDVSIVPTFILTPLMYLGGVFYSVNMLPPFWKTVSFFNPILYMINAFRYGMLGVSDINVFNALAVTISFTIIFYIIAYVLINKGIGIKS